MDLEPHRMMKRLTLCLLCAGALGAAGPSGGADPLRLEELRHPGSVELVGVNGDPYAVRWVWVQLEAADNVVSDQALPKGFVLQPGERRTLTVLRALGAGRGFSYAVRSRSGEGDPDQAPDADAVYRLPWEHGQKHACTQGYFGAVTHQGIHALDFDLAEGTPVLASRDGVVIAVKDDSDEGGMDARFASDGNFVQVMHADATWEVYAHLQLHGAAVQVGQRVRTGQRLGLSGHTGLASGPHLHIAVYRASWDGPKTIPTLFYVGASRTAAIQEGRSYYAWQEGGAPFKGRLAEDLHEDELRGVTRTVGGGKVTLREEKVDQRTLVWADNGTAKAIRLSVSLAEAQGVAASRAPWSGVVPARTEAYCFWVDFLPPGPSHYRLAARWRELP
jgi:murein DD-endopeptidase MepM/ murein hydrolase activator NlpD